MLSSVLKGLSESKNKLFVIEMNIHIGQDEFWEFLNKNIELNDYKYKFLKLDIEKIINRIPVNYSDSFFNIQSDSWILIIRSDLLHIYGDNWAQNQFGEISEYFDLNKFTNYLLGGESQLISALIDFYGVTNFKIEKERNFYRSSKIVTIHSKETIIRPANFEDTITLAYMLQKYYHEEYNGTGDKEISEMADKVIEYISNGVIYVLENDKGEIASFCTILNPDIGILFTSKNFRNRGYGKLILSYCSNLLLESNKEIYLMTDRSKDESNSVSNSIGFQSYFEFSLIRINNS